jgi:nicotinamide riboside transporter PnuC
LGEALSTNLLVVAAVAATAVGVLWWAARRATGTGAERFPLPAARPTQWAALLGVAVLLVAFGVARWTPPLAWAAP